MKRLTLVMILWLVFFMFSAYQLSLSLSREYLTENVWVFYPMK